MAKRERDRGEDRDGQGGGPAGQAQPCVASAASSGEQDRREQASGATHGSPRVRPEYAGEKARAASGQEKATHQTSRATTGRVMTLTASQVASTSRGPGARLRVGEPPAHAMVCFGGRVDEQQGRAQASGEGGQPGAVAVPAAHGDQHVGAVQGAGSSRAGLGLRGEVAQRDQRRLEHAHGVDGAADAGGELDVGAAAARTRGDRGGPRRRRPAGGWRRRRPSRRGRPVAERRGSRRRGRSGGPGRGRCPRGSSGCPVRAVVAQCSRRRSSPGTYSRSPVRSVPPRSTRSSAPACPRVTPVGTPLQRSS